MADVQWNLTGHRRWNRKGTLRADGASPKAFSKIPGSSYGEFMRRLGHLGAILGNCGEDRTARAIIRQMSNGIPLEIDAALEMARHVRGEGCSEDGTEPPEGE